MHTYHKGNGPKCMMNDWISVHYKAFDMDGKLVGDSKGVDGRPKMFRLGHYEVSKCWDIAL